MDIISLVRAAESSEQGEHYCALHSSNEFKIGISAVRQPSGICEFFMELVINLCCWGRGKNMEKLDNAVMILHSLEVAGYDISCDSGEFACEKKVSSECLENELAGIRKLIGIAEDPPTP